jgi:hypothetical protein
VRKGRIPRTDASRLEPLFIPEPNTGCWLWLGATNQYGYGQVHWDGRTRAAHRVSYEVHVGAIPAGAFLCHRCDNPACVNPRHLMVADHAANMADMRVKGRSNHGERNGRARFSAADVQEMRTMRASGASLSAIARRFATDASSVSAIVRGLVWQQL